MLIDRRSFLVMIRLLTLMWLLVSLNFANLGVLFLLETCISKTTCARHVLDKCKMTAQTQITNTSCFHKSLPCKLHFAIRTLISKLRTLFRFLCLVASFYKRWASVKTMYIQYTQHILCNRTNISKRSCRFEHSLEFNWH